MESVKRPETVVPTAKTTFGSEEKQFAPLNLKPYYVYGRFPILPFMATLGVGAYIISLLHDMLVK